MVCSFENLQCGNINVSIAFPAGLVGEFNFQQLLFTLTTSLTLLKIATTIVDFLAFNLLPLKFIYKQYRTFDTVDFSELTDSIAAVFRKHDIINPHPDTILSRVAHVRDLETGHAAAAPAGV
jgi:hypothetical protein